MMVSTAWRVLGSTDNEPHIEVTVAALCNAQLIGTKQATAGVTCWCHAPHAHRYALQPTGSWSPDARRAWHLHMAQKLIIKLPYFTVGTKFFSL